MSGALRERVDELVRQRARASRELRSLLGGVARDGLSQRALASLIGRSQPEVRRLITTSAARAADGGSRTWMTARSATDAAARELRSADEMMAFKMIVQAIEHLRGLRDPDDIAEWAVTPARVPHDGLDTLLQVLTQRAYRAKGLPVPEWAQPRALADEWVLTALPSRAPRVKARTPDYLADLRVYVSEQDLVTA